MKTATGLIAWFLRINGVRAVTLPNKRIYALPGSETDADLFLHEAVHIEQIDRDGPVLWTIKVCWYLVRYGYKDSPYEVEARNNQHSPVPIHLS